MFQGVYYEFISIPCIDKERLSYSMPLGIIFLNHTIKFKVYRGTGLFKILEYYKENIELMMYSPKDPLDFYLSLVHDKDLEKGGPCTPPKPYIMYITCKPVLNKKNENYNEYICGNIRLEKGDPVPYSRAYGCLVEMLVILTKIEAGVSLEFFLNYLKDLKWCVERASPYNSRLKEVAELVLQRALKTEQTSK